jgi:hypothetical protein
MSKNSSFARLQFPRWWLAGVVGILVTAGPPAPVRAQSPPPVQGTMALEGTMKKFYAAANVVVVTTIDGVEHAYRFVTDTVVHGGKGAGVDALEGLSEGSEVVVHYAADGTGQTAQEIDVIGDEALRVTEGRVTHIDRRRQQIAVQYANGKSETLRLTERAAAEAPNDGMPPGANVTMFYRDERGQKVVHFFKKIS